MCILEVGGAFPLRIVGSDGVRLAVREAGVTDGVATLFGYCLGAGLVLAGACNYGLRSCYCFYVVAIH